jgi:spoIIIJ-associated protein
MEWVETTAATVDDAKEQALDELGVDEQDAEFEIVDEPRPGLFGRMRGEARVRARVRPRTPRPKVDRRDRRRRRGGSDDGPGTTPAPRDDAGRGEAGRGDTATTRKTPAGKARGGRRSTSPARTASKRKAAAATAAPKEERAVSENAMTAEDQAERAGEFLGGLAEAFDLTGSVSTEQIIDDLIEVRLEGDELGWMIGPKGATLQSIYDLAKAVVQREADGQRSGRFRIDIGGYRARRREALMRFVEQVAADVRESGSPRSLEPMGASDRKTVHDTVNEITGVATRSEGEEPRRRVVIEPEKE